METNPLTCNGNQGTGLYIEFTFIIVVLITWKSYFVVIILCITGKKWGLYGIFIWTEKYVADQYNKLIRVVVSVFPKIACLLFSIFSRCCLLNNDNDSCSCRIIERQKVLLFISWQQYCCRLLPTQTLAQASKKVGNKVLVWEKFNFRPCYV